MRGVYGTSGPAPKAEPPIGTVPEGGKGATGTSVPVVDGKEECRETDNKWPGIPA